MEKNMSCDISESFVCNTNYIKLVNIEYQQFWTLRQELLLG